MYTCRPDGCWLQALSTVAVSDPYNIVDDVFIIKCPRMQRTLLSMRISGNLRYTGCSYGTSTCPPSGFQAIYMLNFQHFRELPIQIMSEILMYIGCSLSQLAPGFFLYLRGFMNICWVCDVCPEALLLFFQTDSSCQLCREDRCSLPR